MKTPHGQFVDSTCVEKLEKIGFEKRTHLGHPHENISCMYRHTKVGNITLLPLFEESGDNSLYFDYAGGRLKIESLDQLKKLISAFK